MRSTSISIAVLVMIANCVLWAVLNRPSNDVDWSGTVKGVSFSPYQADQNPFKNKYPTADDIDRDLAFLAGKVQRVRTYSSLDGIEVVPALAAKHGLTVTAGAWVDKRRVRNDAEIDNLIHNANSYRSVERVIVGNESILRGDLSVPELAVYLKRVKKAVRVPVSTAEPWHVWIKNPELAQHVDFIAIHILPYWEGLGIDDAMQFLVDRYEQVRKAFPGKPIVIAEAGWPSAGNRLERAAPSKINEARFLREFLNFAERRHVDYFVMEAFDQPWKTAIEGSVGASWGIYNSERQPKFPMIGPVTENPLWPLQATLATVLALLPMVWFFTKGPDLPTRGRIFFAVLLQTAASLIAWTAFVPVTEGLSWVARLAWGVLLPAQFALLIVMLVNGFEFAEMNWTRRFTRRFPSLVALRTENLPKVSLHLAICREPPDLVIQTLNSLAALDYPNYEVLVIDNNTPDPALWEPVQAHCAKLGARFRFFTLGKYPGFKAGALNFALRETAADAEIVGVVDSDYIVRSDWLRATVPYFKRGNVGFVQAPQDHREWENDRFREMCNWEYAGFFHIGMVHRNERNAIIQHGTMTLIRRSALVELGGWSEWCICEDAELGLRLLNHDYQSVYVNNVYGRGLTPHTFAGYKGQRFRWVYGAVQILKRHWRDLLPWAKNNLSMEQRYHFASGWLPWFADALHLVFTVAAVVWTAGLVVFPQWFDFPLAVFMLPTIGMFAFKVFHTWSLYQTRVACDTRQRFGAAIAGMSLTHAIARGVFKGLFTSNEPFLRTPKAEDKPALVRGLAMAREEALLMGGLWLAAATIAGVYGTNNADALLWEVVLLVQSLPYAAALYCALVNVLPALATTPMAAPSTQTPSVGPSGTPAFAGKEPSPRKAA